MEKLLEEFNFILQRHDAGADVREDFIFLIKGLVAATQIDSRYTSKLLDFNVDEDS